MKNNQVNSFAIRVIFILLLIYQTAIPQVSIKEKCSESLLILANDLINLQDLDPASKNYGALYCKTCSDYHTRASESVLPFAVAYKITGNEKYLHSAICTGEWLIKQQQKDGSWVETPSDWTGTTTDQLLMMSVAFPILKDKLTREQSERWKSSVKNAADWLVINMNHVFASINYCATTTATLMTVYNLIQDSSYVKKAKELAHLAISKFDEDYFMEGEGNRIRDTKYGIDLGYNMDMSMWGLGQYARLANDSLVDTYIKKALERYIYFIYPDGSTDGSWGIRSSKWTTYGGFTADGSQILFSLYSKKNPEYRTAALANLNYFMKMRVNGLLTYGPNYYDLFKEAPCIYPTFCRAKNLAMAIVFGDSSSGETPPIPSQKINWAKYFKTIDVVEVRTKNFMATITGYRYKDIRRGADFKYMFRPSGGSISNLWAENYDHLQSSSQTEYHKWEMNYPDTKDTLPITPRIEFTDKNAYYTNLYEFDSHIELSQKDSTFIIETIGELKDRNRWEGGVAYTLKHLIGNNGIEKNIKLRFHGQRTEVDVIEPLIQGKDSYIKVIDDYRIEILGGKQEFVFEILDKCAKVSVAVNADKYRQPFPSFKVWPLTLKIIPEENSFLKEIKYVIRIK